jgi:hypothetical protein
LLDQIKLLDERADEEGLQEDEWAFRYYLEEQLLNLFRVEEEYWRQRGWVRWALIWAERYSFGPKKKTMRGLLG